jgi:ataxia telangiectasia mutated family protein
MLTRLSLLRSVFRLGKSEQLGTIKSNFSVAINELEHECHRKLSSAARLSGDLQVALNFSVRAQALDFAPSADITEELAEVLWQKNEQKVAVDLIRDLEGTLKESKGKDQIKRARLLARIVSHPLKMPLL